LNSIVKAAQLGIRLLKISVSNPRRLSHVLGSALEASGDVLDRSLDIWRLPRVGLHDLLPDQGDLWAIKMLLFPRSYASISLVELTGLILLLKKAKAGNVFEFGTYKGVSITQFALNLPGENLICTLDLPEGTENTHYTISDPYEAEITFLKQDSAFLDESAYAGRMDFVFVDGAHCYDYVKSDSEKGWRMLRSGGIIAWHDCRHQDPDVVRYLLSCSYKPTLISGTSVAFAQKP